MKDFLRDTRFEIGLSSWIIQDGNYGDFYVRGDADFALEFYCETFEKSSVAQKSFERVAPATYRINGEVILSREGLWVLDFGLRAFEERRPSIKLVQGDFISGVIHLGIDPFFYFESLSAAPGVPPLIYNWKIENILQQTAPFIETRSEIGQRIFTRDAEKLGWKAIQKTDAWSDDGGNGDYVLVCALLNAEPRSQMAKKYTL